MSRIDYRWSLLIAPLLLWGCLLPQPDTPLIPPTVMAPGTEMANGTMPPADTSRSAEPTLAPTVAATGLISGRVTGEGISAIKAVPVGAGTEVRGDVGESGVFDLTLAPGDYQLEVTVDGQPLRAKETIAVKAGETRTFEVAVSRQPTTITVTETTAPEETATATPTGTATP